MNKRFGIVQGRLIKPVNKNLLQYFPPNWIEEIDLAKGLNFGFVEFFKDRNFNSICPFFFSNGFYIVKKILNLKNFKSYSFCDDFFINNNILKYESLKKYFNDIATNLSILKTKLYILPLFEKSDLNKKNFLNFTSIINLISRILKKKKIILALEINLDIKHIEILFKKINCKNVFLVYDTGNRVKAGNYQQHEIIKLRSKIIHVHIKDKNLLGENVILGKGNVDFKKIFLGLKQIKYKKKFTFETNRGNIPVDTMKNNIKIIKKICRTIKYTII